MTTQIDQDAFGHDEQMFGPQDSPAAVLHAARELAERLIQEAADALPEYDHAAHMEACLHHDLHVATGAQEQWCRYNPQTVTAYSNGWDDLGDMTGPMWLQCSSCGGAWIPPDDLDWA